MTRHPVFRMKSSALRDAAEWVVRAASSKTTAPILSGVLIEAAEDTVTLTAFDYDCLAKVTLDAHVDSPGSLLLPGRLLVAVAAVADGTADMRVNGKNSPVEVTAGKARWTLPDLPVEDYPKVPDAGESAGTVDAAEFREAVLRVLPAAWPAGGPLVNLTGVRIESEGDQMTLVATDRFRMGVATIPWVPKTNQPLNCLVPQKILEIAVRGIEQGTLNLHVGEGFGGNLFGVSTPTRLVVGAQLAESYPNWRGILPAPSEWTATFQVSELAKAVRQVSPALREKNPVLVLAIDAGRIGVSAVSDLKVAQVEVDSELEGDPIEIAVNSTYLKGALDMLGSDMVTARFLSPKRPVLLTGDDPDRYRHIMMPANPDLAKKGT